MTHPGSMDPALVALLEGNAPTDVWLASDEAEALLSDPNRRARLYAEMQARPSPAQAPLLRVLLRHEVDLRMEDDDDLLEDDDYDFEQLYWPALLLSGLGFVEDALLIWRAKHIDFDTGVGLDVQYIVGAGVRETLAHLDALDDPEAARAAGYLRQCEAAGDFADLDGWRAAKLAYWVSRHPAPGGRVGDRR